MEKKSIAELIETAKAAKLLGVEFLEKFEVAALEHEYNGIGPEWCGAAIRAVVTEKFSLFEPAALIHDLRTTVSDGPEMAFHVANQEFYINCSKLADGAYPHSEYLIMSAILAAGMFLVGSWVFFRYEKKFAEVL